MSYNSIQEELGKLLSDLKKPSSFMRSADWQYIVGKREASLCRFESFRSGELMIRADSNAVRSLLLLNKGGILKRFQERFPQEEAKQMRIIV